MSNAAFSVVIDFVVCWLCSLGYYSNNYHATLSVSLLMLMAFLAERCYFIAMSGYCHVMLYVVVTLVYCDKTTEVSVMQFFSKNIARCLHSLPAKFDYAILRGPLDRGLKLGCGGFQIRDAISRKCFEIELR